MSPLQKFVLVIACCNVVYRIADVLCLHYFLEDISNYENVYWSCTAVAIDLALCSMLAYGAVKKTHWFVLPWLTYNAFLCVFTCLSVVLRVYTFLAQPGPCFPLGYVVRHLALAGVGGAAWFSVAAFYRRCREEALLRDLEVLSFYSSRGRIFSPTFEPSPPEYTPAAKSTV